MSKDKIVEYIRKLYGITADIEEELGELKATSPNGIQLSGIQFEDIVYEHLTKADFEETSIEHSTQKFPDFVIEDKIDGSKLGVEVKKTDSAKWEVIGGSIYESLKNDIEDTYVLMAKMGGAKPEVRLKKYEECISDLKVTHSPRFYLNMDLKEGQDYLTLNEAKDLLELSGDELNRKIRRLLRTQKSTWWSEAEIVAFSDLEKEERDAYLNEGVALFPEVLKGDYRNFTPWLVYNCLVWCGNVRDIFSAGGNKFIKNANVYVSAVMYRVLEHSKSICRRINNMTSDEIEKFWRKSPAESMDRIGEWLRLVECNLRLSKDLIQNNQKLAAFEGMDESIIREKIKKIYIRELENKIR